MVLGTIRPRGKEESNQAFSGSREVKHLSRGQMLRFPLIVVWQTVCWALLLLATGPGTEVQQNYLMQVNRRCLLPFQNYRSGKCVFLFFTVVSSFLLLSFLWFKNICMNDAHIHTHTFSVLGIPHPNCHHLVEASRDMCLALSSDFSELCIFS